MGREFPDIAITSSKKSMEAFFLIIKEIAATFTLFYFILRYLIKSVGTVVPSRDGQ
jgi:hypothetical protein